MAEHAGPQGAVWRFSGGTDTPSDYMTWNQWATAYLRARDVSGEQRGPLLFTLLDGTTAVHMEDLDVDIDLAVTGGEAMIFERLDARFPEQEPQDKVAEALDVLFELQLKDGETMVSYAGRVHQAFARTAVDRHALPHGGPGVYGPESGPAGVERPGCGAGRC